MGKFTTTILLCITLLLLFITIFGNYGFKQLSTLDSQLKRMQMTNKHLEAEIVQLENKMHAAQESSHELERRAREQLSLSKPGEIVYIFPAEKKSE